MASGESSSGYVETRKSLEYEGIGEGEDRFKKLGLSKNTDEAGEGESLDMFKKFDSFCLVMRGSAVSNEDDCAGGPP